MNKILNAVKEKFNIIKQNPLMRTVLISALALLLVVSVTLAWYINNMGLWGMEFNTGNIDFNTYVYDENGTLVVGPVSSTDENESKYINAPLVTLDNAQIGTTGTAYIVVESTGSIGIQYRIAFDITGRTEKSTAYIGGYKYNITKVTDKVDFNGEGNLDISDCPDPEKINNELITIDKNAINGTIEKKNGYDVYRIDYTLAQKNEEYTGSSIKVYYNIFATQIGGDFESSEERGYTYYCSTKEDIDRAKVEAYPGDIIKLSADIVYYGDLVFNKPVNLETNDCTLTVNGNLMYDYVLNNGLKLDVGGLGQIIVQCTKDGVGGNFQIKAPISNVTINGSNASGGDIVVEKNVIIDATNSLGSAGVSFNEVKIIDLKNTRKMIQLDSNTRATVSFGTTIGMIQSIVKANNIEIVNNGEIGEINLSNMSLLEQTNSPQIYILNNNNIDNPIMLPDWSVKFEETDGKCVGNTRIVQSFTGGVTEVTGTCEFDNSDVEIERKDSIVEQIEEGNDSRLKIYYQDIDGTTTTIKSILENYLENEATSGCKLHEVVQLEIISVGDKAITNADIAFMNSNEMLSLSQLDMQRANVYDSATDTYHKLPDNSFKGVSKYENLVLPQNLVEIGKDAFYSSKIDNIITIPSGVTAFGSNWFYSGKYVGFAASVPITEAAVGLTNVKAIFVDEAYISSYKSVYSGYSTRIYPVSVLDETKTHFVRNIENDEWEITYFIGGDDAVIGENVSIDGTFLKITSVYDNAYRYNFSGTKVDFADTVENLGSYNFNGNDKITDVDLNNLKHVGDSAFYNTKALQSVLFGDYLETIGNNAFDNCVSLNQDVILPDSMQTIGTAAFRKTKIKSVNTGGTTFVDVLAFYNCADLVYAVLPNVEVVGGNGNNQLFDSCTSLVSADMPKLAKIYGNYMFRYCTSLSELYLGIEDASVSFGSYSFNNVDTSKIKLYVPEHLVDLYKEKSVFNTNQIYPRGEKFGSESINGFVIGDYIFLENSIGYTLVTSNLDFTGDVTLLDEYNNKPITAIYANAFRHQNFADVTLTIGERITTIGAGAFYGREGLLKVEFGSSLDVIDSGAFAYCSNMCQNVVLPDSMERIEREAFRNSGILSINTGGTKSVETRAFANCTSLVYVIMPEVRVVAESGTNEVFLECTSLVSADMPKLAKIYGYYMFRYCTSLSELYLGIEDASVSFGSYSFNDVDTSKIKLFVPVHLVSLYREKQVFATNQVYPRGEKLGDKSINGFVVGDYIVLENGNGYTLVTSHSSFEGKVIVPDTYNNKPITEIYSNAFRNQTFSDVDLVLGENLQVIGNGAFYGRTGLKSVSMNRVTTIGDNAFYASGIMALNAPKLTNIGSNAFGSCIDLETVSIPKIESITSGLVFANCTNLKSVYFENVKSVNANTFQNDKNLEKITINRLINSNGDNMPATMNIDASAPCKIYVPYRSLFAYPSVWSGKPVVSFDVSATFNGDTYILVDNNGRYTLIDFVPGQAITSLIMPTMVDASQIGAISIYAIGEGAFSSVADTLKTLTLSSTIAQLNGSALSECTVLENIYVDPNNMYFISVNGVLYSTDAKMLVKYPVGRDGRFDMTDADYASTVGIGANAFANATKLTEIVFPESLMVIDSTAFANCMQLNTVEFTGNTPPVLMGASIFDITVEGFKMVIPTDNADVVTTYLCAYNFGEYEPYIDLNGHAAPDANTPRNQVPMSNPVTRNNTYAMLNLNNGIGKEDEDNDNLPEDETDGE